MALVRTKDEGQEPLVLLDTNLVFVVAQGKRQALQHQPQHTVPIVVKGAM